MKNNTENNTEIDEAKKNAFLEAKIFQELENQHKGIKDKSIHYFPKIIDTKT